jgi:hypothetical protein
MIRRTEEQACVRCPDRQARLNAPPLHSYFLTHKIAKARCSRAWCGTTAPFGKFVSEKDPKLKI